MQWECLFGIILGWNLLEQTIEINILDIAKLQSFVRRKPLKPETKIVLFGCSSFLTLNLKTLLSCLQPDPRIFKTQCFAQKQRSLNLGSKLSLFRVFWLEFEKTVVIFEVSTPRIYKSAKFWVKMFKFMTKFCLIYVYFGLEFEKTIVIFEVSTLEIYHKWICNQHSEIRNRVCFFFLKGVFFYGLGLVRVQVCFIKYDVRYNHLQQPLYK